MRKVWGESWPGRSLARDGEELGEARGEDREQDHWDQTGGQPGRHRDQPAVIKPAESVLTGHYIFN